MSDQIDPLESVSPEAVAVAVEEAPVEPVVPLEPAPSIDSRFLFVDVASRRANQLRRGAVVRVTEAGGHRVPHKLERIAMEEVKNQLIHYEVPDLPESSAAKK
jgi:DNA-directed RNA polymerase subunit K/omega